MSLTNGVLTALPAPPGYVVDFENPSRNSETAAYWVAGVGNFLSLLFIGQRFYVNGFVKRSLRLDDGKSQIDLLRYRSTLLILYDISLTTSSSMSFGRLGKSQHSSALNRAFYDTEFRNFANLRWALKDFLCYSSSSDCQ